MRTIPLLALSLFVLALSLAVIPGFAQAADYPLRPARHHRLAAMPAPGLCYRVHTIYVRYVPRLATNYWVKPVLAREPVYCD